MENPIKPAKLAAAKTAMANALAELIPDFVEFPAELVLTIAKQAVDNGAGAKVRFELGLDDQGKVAGFMTPIGTTALRTTSEAVGETVNTGAPCPPWCDPG